MVICNHAKYLQKHLHVNCSGFVRIILQIWINSKYSEQIQSCIYSILFLEDICISECIPWMQSWSPYVCQGLWFWIWLLRLSLWLRVGIFNFPGCNYQIQPWHTAAHYWGQGDPQIEYSEDDVNGIMRWGRGDNGLWWIVWTVSLVYQVRNGQDCVLENTHRLQFTNFSGIWMVK